jgi:hypothetical protein
MMFHESRLYAADRGGPLVILITLALLVTGCAVDLIARRDTETISMTDALRATTNDHLQRLAGETAPACLHEAHRAFYAQEKNDVAALERRVVSQPKNDPTIEQVRGLGSSLASLEELHKRSSASGRCLAMAELSPLSRGIDTSFASILEIERAKPAGSQSR